MPLVPDLTIIPEHMRESVKFYLEHGREPGSFLRHILENDFAHAAIYADHINQACLLDWARLLIFELPMGCWGSKEQVNAWIAKKESERIAQSAVK